MRPSIWNLAGVEARTAVTAFKFQSSTTCADGDTTAWAAGATGPIRPPVAAAISAAATPAHAFVCLKFSPLSVEDHCSVGSGRRRVRSPERTRQTGFLAVGATPCPTGVATSPRRQHPAHGACACPRRCQRRINFVGQTLAYRVSRPPRRTPDTRCASASPSWSPLERAMPASERAVGDAHVVASSRSSKSPAAAGRLR